jgi:hypothetical protein
VITPVKGRSPKKIGGSSANKFDQREKLQDKHDTLKVKEALGCLSDLTGASSGIKQVKLFSNRKPRAIDSSECKCTSLEAGCELCAVNDQIAKAVD